MAQIYKQQNIRSLIETTQKPLKRGKHGGSDKQLATGDMHELIIWQKKHAEPDKRARTKNTIRANEPAMRAGATNRNRKLLHK